MDRDKLEERIEKDATKFRETVSMTENDKNSLKLMMKWFAVFVEYEIRQEIKKQKL
jgi:hypothetical protein